MCTPRIWRLCDHRPYPIDFAAFVVMNVLLLKMVFGIILDKFSELRDERNQIDKDHMTQCFICGLPQKYFDRVSCGAFKRHVDAEHSVWDYIFFVHQARLRPRRSIGAMDKYVLTCIDKGDPSVYPIGAALLLIGPRD